MGCALHGTQYRKVRTKASLVQREVPPSFGAPAKPSVSGFAGERRSSGMSELLPSRQNEGYEACDDEAEGLMLGSNLSLGTARLFGSS